LVDFDLMLSLMFGKAVQNEGHERELLGKGGAVPFTAWVR
jgi:hypothetical protein